MSYLDLPRVIFDGDFQADVSTVNNITQNYDISTFDPETSPRAWNPTGSAAFRLLNCRVRGVRDEKDVATKEDPLLTARITGSSDRVSGKILDLDTQWQLSSALWGLRVELRAGEDLILAGDFEPAAFRDLWFQAGLAARFQSVLHNIVWARPGVSRIADRLRAATTGGKLSIRLGVFGYTFDNTSPRFTLGTVVGAIGPYQPGEPHTFHTGRRFAPNTEVNAGVFNHFDGVIAAGRLTVDLANALPVLDDKGAVADQGELRFGVLTDPATDEGATVVEGTGFTALGPPLPYREPGWLLDTSGIVTVPARVDIANRPLALLRANGADHTVMIRETPDGWLVRAEQHIHRAQPGDTLTTKVYVTRFGRPVNRAEVTPLLQPPVPSEPPIGTPPSAFTVLRPNPTGPDGQTTLRIRCTDPGNPRRFIDGQIYQLDLGIRGVDQASLRQSQLEPITGLIFDDYEIPANPTWFDDVLPILKQYANLYPIMSERLFRLDDYEMVRQHRKILQFAFSRDLSDPNSMPVTRDLSAAKRRMILSWLALPDLPLGVERPRPAPGAPAPAPSDEIASKDTFARDYLRAIEGIES